MEANEIKTLADLQELARKQFKTLEADTHTKDLFTAKFSVIGYKDLLFVIPARRSLPTSPHTVSKQYNSTIKAFRGRKASLSTAFNKT